MSSPPSVTDYYWCCYYCYYYNEIKITLIVCVAIVISPHPTAVFLHSTTGPIIESSSNISIGCYNYAYFGLESHLESADMSIWENEWYSVYDFTPANNFKLLETGDPMTFIETVIPVSVGWVRIICNCHCNCKCNCLCNCHTVTVVTCPVCVCVGVFCTGGGRTLRFSFRRPCHTSLMLVPPPLPTLSCVRLSLCLH
jgi:hypothetical protein